MEEQAGALALQARIGISTHFNTATFLIPPIRHRRRWAPISNVSTTGPYARGEARVSAVALSNGVQAGMGGCLTVYSSTGIHCPRRPSIHSSHSPKAPDLRHILTHSICYLIFILS